MVENVVSTQPPAAAAMTKSRQLAGVRVPAEPLPAQLTDEQQAALDAIARSAGATLIVGGPGSGKTTALVSSVVQRVRAGESLSSFVVLANSRPAAQAARAQIIAGIGQSQRSPGVMTLYGWAYAQLVRLFATPGDAPRLLTAPEQELRVRELLNGFDDLAWPPQIRQAVPTKGFAREVRAVLARSRQLGWDPSDLQRLSTATGRPEYAALADFFGNYLDVLDLESVIDYPELIHRLRLAMADPDTARSITKGLATIYVDEFAELDRAQIMLLADLHKAGVGIAAFSDPTTSVFGFRGAESGATANFAQWFGGGSGVTRVDLTHFLRGGPQLASATASVGSRLNLRGGPAWSPLESVLGASSDDQDEAVAAVVVADEQAASDFIAEQLRTAHARSGLRWDQMAVITRAGHTTVSQLARRLAASGVPVQVSGDEIALRDEVSVRPLLEVLEAARAIAAGDVLGPGEATRLMRSPIGTTSGLGLRKLGRTLRLLDREETGTQEGSGRISSELLAAELVSAHLVADELPDGAADELVAVVAMRKLLAELAERIQSGDDPASLLWRAWSATDWPERLRIEAFGAGDGAARANRDLDAVIALFDVAQRSSELSGEKGLRMFLSEVESQQIPADTARESDPQGRGVSVLTVHRAKGMQWPFVVVTGVQEGQWPRVSVASSLLDADRLEADGMAGPRVVSEVVAADRRAFLLATSRASRRLLVVATRGVEGEANRESRFLAELGMPVRQIAVEAPSNLDGLVARLRQAAGDEALGSGLRQEAAAQLAALARATDAQGRQLVPAASPERWWGTDDYSMNTAAPLSRPGEPVRLAVTDVEPLLTCPRQWFLDRRAKARDSQSTAASIGTIIHALAEHALKDELDRETVDQSLDTVWDEIEFDAAWLSASQRVLVSEALDRLAGWNAVHSPEAVLGVEVPFTMTVPIDDDAVTITGTVDRIERDSSGAIRIVDFKSQKKPPTQPQAERLDQMGIYQLAVQSGALDHVTGGVRDVADAELVYLRTQQGKEPMPKVMVQPSLDSRPHADGEDQTRPTWVHDRLAEAIGHIRNENFCAKAGAQCMFCAFAVSCPTQQGGN